MRPPTQYFGSKGRLAPWIASLLPPARTYVEPFCGSAAVLFAKPPSPTEVINDADGDLVLLFRMLRDHGAEVARALRLTPYARAELAAANLDAAGLDELERASAEHSAASAASPRPSTPTAPTTPTSSPAWSTTCRQQPGDSAGSSSSAAPPSR